MPLSTPTATYSDTAPLFLPVFSRHETFHPRFGWLKKGFDLAQKNPNVFSEEDAPVILGVGKNMVNAIRYWTVAFKILKKSEHSESKSRQYEATDFGSRLLADKGWDPYLEHLGSLWLLHWYLVKPLSTAPSWYFGMNVFPHIEFSTDEFLKALSEFRDIHFPKANAALSSLKKDMNCFLRMYAETSHKKGVKEESIDSPFTQLGLIQSQRNSHYQFNTGFKPTLPSAIIVFACLDFAASLGVGQTLNLDSLMLSNGSPGFVFKLNESSLSEAILEVSKSFDAIQLTEAAGLLQLSFQGDPAQLGIELLKRFYEDQA